MILLDTCAAIYITQNQKIKQEAEDLIDASFKNNELILISPMSAWEVGLLCSKGRLPSINGPLVWYQKILSIDGISEAKLNAEILVRSSYLGNAFHSDPSDRILVATAIWHNATILTRDKKILAFAASGGCMAMEC